MDPSDVILANYYMRRLKMLVLPLAWIPLADFLLLGPPLVIPEAMVLSMVLPGSLGCLFCLGSLSAGVRDFSLVAC